MKILIYSDVHWASYSSIIRKRGQLYSVRLEHLIDSMNWVEKLGESLGCDLEICSGDFTDRSDLLAEEITSLREIKWNNINKRFIVGNHDSNISNLKFNAVSAINRDNIKILCDTLEEDIDGCHILYLPYRNDYDNLNEKIVEFGNKWIDNKFIFSHADIKGINYGRFESVSGIDMGIVKNSCNMLFNGHLHEGGKVSDNIINIGSLSAHNFTNDSFTHQYGVYILDTQTRSIEFIENPYAFNFYKIKVETKKDLDKLKKLKNNSVVSLICVDTLINEANEIIRRTSNIVEHRITVFYTSDGECFDNNLKVEDHFKQFIDFVQTRIEPSQALSDELSRLSN